MWIRSGSCAVWVPESCSVNDGCCQRTGREEQDRASVVSSSDALPLVHSGEHVVDLVAQAAEVFVVGDGDLPVAAGRDAG